MWFILSLTVGIILTVISGQALLQKFLNLGLDVNKAIEEMEKRIKLIIYIRDNRDVLKKIQWPDDNKGE